MLDFIPRVAPRYGRLATNHPQPASIFNYANMILRNAICAQYPELVQLILIDHERQYYGLSIAPL